MHSFALNAEELFNMEYINIDERKKEPANMVWKRRERTKKTGKRMDEENTLFKSPENYEVNGRV